MQETIMDQAAGTKPASLSDAETPASRPGAKSLLVIIIAAAAIAYLVFGSSLTAYF
jgi:hypothetical protein